MQVKYLATVLVLGVALATTANAAERMTKEAEVVSLDSGVVLVGENRNDVLQDLNPVGRKGPVPASKREVIKVGVYTSDELQPNALVDVKKRVNTTSVEMTRNGVLDTGRPVHAVEGEVETVTATDIISLLPAKDDKVHSFGGTVKNGDLYYARNGGVYQYIGNLK